MAQQQSQSLEIFERLREEIRLGTYPVGGRLPSEPSLCREFGVSRPVIRETIARLRADGLVISRQGSGTFVQQTLPGPTSHGFAPVTNLKDIQDCFDFRSGLETEAAAFAAKNRDDEDLENLKRSWGALERAIEAGESANDEDFEFHVAIAQASRIHFFTSVLSSMRKHILVGISLADELSFVQQTKRQKLVRNEHSEIYTAILERDPERAAKAMRAHIENSRRRLFEGSD